MTGGSSVAGIIDQAGGLRVVVTELWCMKYHVGLGEKLFVVPGLRVTEPVPFGEVPALMETVRRHVASRQV